MLRQFDPQADVYVFHFVILIHVLTGGHVDLNAVVDSTVVLLVVTSPAILDGIVFLAFNHVEMFLFSIL
jgi:energy-converting hydrogenase Eha subunit E